MYRGLTRKFGAFFLLFAFLLSATAIAPLSISAQTDGNPKKDDKKAKQTSVSQTDSKKPLSTNENPEMIGKRNINGGGDKFWGWLGGSQEKEVQIGRQLSIEVEQSAKMIEDEMVTEYINRVGQNIVLHSDAKIPFTIKVIDSDEVNAFALPGGFFYVNKGLILAADNESELAGVMAHEIAHVAARHAMENHGKGQLSITDCLPESFLEVESSAPFCKTRRNLHRHWHFFKFSRGAEEEADRSRRSISVCCRL